MIYCVEDERNIRELLIYTLETTGFKDKNGTYKLEDIQTGILKLEG